MTQCTDHPVFCIRKYQPENEMACPLVAEPSISIGRSLDTPLLHINNLVSTRSVTLSEVAVMPCDRIIW